MSISFLIFFLFNMSQAGIIKNDATGLRRFSFSFNEVCKYMGQNETLIVEAEGPGRLDCMGSKINLNDFCSKKEKGLELLSENLSLTRGVNDPLSKTVFCEKASSLTLSYKCQKKDRSDICFSATKGCKKLNEIFAINMETSYTSIIDQTGGKILNCYFSSKNDEQNLKID